ncbi:hypothetical protein ILYODFUR_005137 [Ilyodon furcidens]|uniref:Uncharacterized protein n=1 Tax=Ilyodon furcidens TaxID=33524 RepID=A0ABV0SUB1_9TELE
MISSSGLHLKHSDHGSSSFSPDSLAPHGSSMSRQDLGLPFLEGEHQRQWRQNTSQANISPISFTEGKFWRDQVDHLREPVNSSANDIMTIRRGQTCDEVYCEWGPRA